MFEKFLGKKEFRCLLITPPPLECNTFYAAMPILTGQLINKGYKAENLDLNIKFFRYILTKDYIKKTEKLMRAKNISYDELLYKNISENIENAVKDYREISNERQEYKDAEETINSALKFISQAYPNLTMTRLGSFEYCFTGFQYNWQNIKNMTFNQESNIFIEYFENIIKEIKREKYNFIAIAVPFIGTLIPALTLSRLLKEKTKAKVILGGNFLKQEDVIKHPEIFDIYCDFILTGDAEETIVELAQAVKENNSVENIAGLIYKNKKNIIINNKIRPVISMNKIANMSLKGLDLNEYMQKYPNIYLIVSKGCYWGKCTFCSLGPKYERYTIKSVEKVIEDIKELKQMYPMNNWFLFQDDALSPAYLNKLSEALIKEDININYSIFARFEKEFTQEMLKKLYKSGLRAIYWGLESGSYSMLKKMNKGINLDNVPEILKNCYELGISNMAGIIVNFPTETQEEYNETLEFLKKVEKYVTISPGQYGLMRNSYIAKNNEKYGIKILRNNEFCYCFDWEDTNINSEEKQQRWDYFCKCVNNGEYKIDENKKAGLL